MQIQGETSVNKLILLFVFDKMETALSERTIVEMCTAGNTWLNYMDCMELLPRLVDDGVICRVSPSAEETLYTMDLGASTLSVNENGEVVSGEFYFLAENDSDKSHYRVTYQKSDGVAKATDLQDAPFEGTNRGFLMQLRRAMVELIEEFPGKAMEVKYVPLGYNFNLSQYAGIYYHAYNASSFTKVAADASFHYNNYLEVTVGEEIYFVALGTNALN